MQASLLNFEEVVAELADTVIICPGHRTVLSSRYGVGHARMAPHLRGKRGSAKNDIEQRPVDKGKDAYGRSTEWKGH